MRRAIGFLLVLAIGVASAAQQAETDKGKTPDYYPLKPGTKWNYQAEGNGVKYKAHQSDRQARNNRWEVTRSGRNDRQGEHG